MRYQKGLSDNYQGDRYLTFTEAAEFLGAGRHTRISLLVKRGQLRGYQIPGISKLRVRKSELLNLIKIDKQNITESN